MLPASPSSLTPSYHINAAETPLETSRLERSISRRQVSESEVGTRSAFDAVLPNIIIMAKQIEALKALCLEMKETSAIQKLQIKHLSDRISSQQLRSGETEAELKHTILEQSIRIRDLEILIDSLTIELEEPEAASAANPPIPTIVIEDTDKR